MYTLTLTEWEMNWFYQALDSAIRHDWLKSVEWVNALFLLLKNAKKEEKTAEIKK